MNRIGAIGVWAVLSLWGGSSAAAQVIRGVVTDRSTGSPIRGAFVALLRPDGRQATGVLTGSAGEFVFRAPPGTYSLRAERIGHQTASVAAFQIEAEQARTVNIQLEVAALQLSAITVRTDARCDRVEGSRETAAVWDEARKALTVTAWVESSSSAVFRVRHTERELDEGLREVGSPQIRFSSAAGKRAFRTIDHDSLERFGYVYMRGADRYFVGPDADLLLSSSFLSQHCFRLVRRNDRRGMIGLAFEPIRGRTVPDIQGALWLDQNSAELRFVEYGYTGHPAYTDSRYAGGRIEFDQLSNGAWIVRNWWIRAPQLVRTEGQSQIRAAGARETMGEVLDAQVAGTAPTVMVPRVSITGFVFDSVRSRPLEGALVYLSGTPFQTTSGVAGRFRLDSIPAGEYGISFEHPFLDSLPVYPGPRTLRIDPGMGMLPLATPSTETLTAQVCPLTEIRRLSAATRDTTTNRGIVFGIVQATDGRSLEGVEVGAMWRRVHGPSTSSPLSSLTVRPYSISASVDAGGRYLLCAVPFDHPVQLDINFRDQMLARDSVRLYPLNLLRRDFVLPRR
jgi:hypothetical protein